MSILEEIIANKKKELIGKKGPTLLVSHGGNQTRREQKGRTLIHERRRVSIIAEIKKKSPSVGDLSHNQDLVVKAIEYETGGADSLSVVTDEKYFGGSLELFCSIRKATRLPILMKDFVIHPYQVYEAEQTGADALLIIAAIYHHYHPDLLSTLSASTIIPVVEVATMEELMIPFVQQAEIIGVNARDLNTFQINIDRACSIIKKISINKTVIAFSGVKSCHDVERFKAAGAKAVLVGELLMKSKDATSVIHSLKHEN